jgi:hypothetical protein
MQQFTDKDFDRLWKKAGVPPYVLSKFLDCVAQGLVNMDMNRRKVEWHKHHGDSTIDEQTWHM